MAKAPGLLASLATLFIFGAAGKIGAPMAMAKELIERPGFEDEKSPTAPQVAAGLIAE